MSRGAGQLVLVRDLQAVGAALQRGAAPRPERLLGAQLGIGLLRTGHVLHQHSNAYRRGGGGGYSVRGGNMNLQILARQNLCHFLTRSEHYVWFPKNALAREKQWALAVRTRTNP